MSGPPRKLTNRRGCVRAPTSCGPSAAQVVGHGARRGAADRHDAAPSSPCRARARRSRRGRRGATSRSIVSDARSPHAYISSSSARSRSAIGSVPFGWSSSRCTSARPSTRGSLRLRRGARQLRRRVGLAHALAAQVAVEGAQRTRPCAGSSRSPAPGRPLPLRQLGQEVRDVGRRRRPRPSGRAAPRNTPNWSRSER